MRGCKYFKKIFKFSLFPINYKNITIFSVQINKTFVLFFTFKNGAKIVAKIVFETKC